VEGAVEYAQNLGLSPAPEYRKVQPIFGDIDPSESQEEFVFGNRGMPCYVNGPYDGPEKIKRILACLDDNCGEGNFKFVFMSGGDPMDDWGGGLASDDDQDQFDNDSDW
jgi:hypothetical protein